MYGLVNQALEDFVRRGFGDAAWKQIRDNAGLNLEMFVSMDSYPDAWQLKAIRDGQVLIDQPVTEFKAAVTALEACAKRPA